MHPIYRFELSANNVTRIAYPVYKGDLAIDYDHEQGQQFYRGKLSGKLTFERNDYAFIQDAAFDTQFDLNIFISQDAGQSWNLYWQGQFWKTDCEFDEDAQTIVVTPTVKDQYTDVLAGLEKEFNLIDLAPEIQEIDLDKRPMIQVYVPGQTVIGCFLSGMWWEQECESVTNENTLRNTYYFGLLRSRRIVGVSGTMTPELPETMMLDNPPSSPACTITGGDYTLHIFEYYDPDLEQYSWRYEISNTTTGVVMWRKIIYSGSQPALPLTQTLNPVAGTGATGDVTIYVEDIKVYGRFVCDVDNVLGLPTNEIPDNDIVADNRNYHRVIEYSFSDTITFSAELSATPTKWGIYQPGQYYVEPVSLFTTTFFPVARSAWGRISIWFSPSSADQLTEEAGRAAFTLKDAFPLWSVINVLLGKVAPGISHSGTTAYSQFLYGQNPLTDITQYLFITPKSNLIVAGYDQPAQKAPITLGAVLDMLRDCYKCYWFIDAQDRFRIEHITYFLNGGSYSESAGVGVDLTQLLQTRNQKEWAFGKNQYEFDKPNMAARYEFAWMDDVTQIFEGWPIDIISKYVNPDNIEKISVSKFTSDIDYILLQPSEISKDGFVLLAAQYSNDRYKLPYVEFTHNGTAFVLQNGWAAFVYLQQFYFYDMPARVFEIDGVEMDALGVARLKKQEVTFPVPNDLDIYKTIRTNIGDGSIEKISVNLSSRTGRATLKFEF